MNVIRQDQFDALRRAFVDGLSIRRAQAVAGVSRHTALRYSRLMRGEQHEHSPRTVSVENLPADGDCSQASQPARLATWKAAGNSVPDGKRLGWICDQLYCWKLEHMALADDKTFGHQRVAPYVARLAEMQAGEYFDIPKPASMRRFRAAFTSASNRLRCAIRTAPDGRNIRLIRLGDWFNNEAADKIAEQFPVVWHPLSFNSKPWQKPTCIFLGQFQLNHFDEELLARPRKRTCSEKACVFPALSGKELCHKHLHFFEFKWSMEWKAIGFSDTHPTDNSPIPHYSVMQRWEEPRSAELTRFEHNGTFNRGEKLSNDWWRENVERYVAQIPKPDIHVTVSREPKAQYVPETKIDNVQHTGAFVLWKGFGKKKIRKRQRMRPQGWHGNHPEQKPRERFTRDTLDKVPMWAPQPVEAEQELYMDDDMGYVPLFDESDHEQADGG